MHLKCNYRKGHRENDPDVFVTWAESSYPKPSPGRLMALHGVPSPGAVWTGPQFGEGVSRCEGTAAVDAGVAFCGRSHLRPVSGGAQKRY